MNQDSKWSVVSAIATIVSLFIPFIILYFSGRHTKELMVETVSISVPVDLSDPRLSSLKLTYKDTPVDRLTVATIEFSNTGSQSIEQRDFEHPVRLSFQKSVDVLAVTLSEKSPDDLNPKIIPDVNGISIAPLLLNPGDRFRITVQTRGLFVEPNVEARISGLTTVTRRLPHEPLLKSGYFQLAIGIIGLIAYGQVGSFAWVAARKRLPYTTLPFPESALTVLTTLTTSLMCGLIGLITLGSDPATILSWRYSFLLVLGFTLTAPFAYWRARRIADGMYK